MSGWMSILVRVMRILNLGANERSEATRNEPNGNGQCFIEKERFSLSSIWDCTHALCELFFIVLLCCRLDEDVAPEVENQ